MAGTPLKSSESRVFLIEGRARPDHTPVYQSCMRMQGTDQSFGDVERIENPDPAKYGRFVEVGEVVGATDRPTTTLEGRYDSAIVSELLRLGKKGCSLDVQLHIGKCKDPRSFNEFDKAVVLENARITNHTTDDLGALESGDNAVVNETADISASRMYEVVPVSYGVKASNIVTNEVLAVTLCDQIGCGECQDESDGCQKIFAVTKSAGGSPSTPPDVVYSIDGGQTWYAHDIETLGAAEDPSGIACLGDYIIVVSNASGSLHYAPKTSFDGLTDPVWTEVATGFVTGGEPNAIYVVDNVGFIVGDNGYIYKCTDPTSGVEVLDAGSATTGTLRDVHAFSTDFAMAVGDNGTVVYTQNGTTWATAAASPVGFATNINCCWMLSETMWIVGATTLYYTLNSGNVWTEKTFYQSGSGVVEDIFFSTDSVGWFSYTISTRGRVYRSFNGGNSWATTPEKTGSIPLTDKLNALVGCSENVNMVVAVGLADDGADGSILLGLGA